MANPHFFKTSSKTYSENVEKVRKEFCEMTYFPSLTKERAKAYFELIKDDPDADAFPVKGVVEALDKFINNPEELEQEIVETAVMCPIKPFIKQNCMDEKEIKDRTFCFTGFDEESEDYKNMVRKIESCGGIIANSVTKKLDYLIVDVFYDWWKPTSKFKKAVQYGKDIVSGYNMPIFDDYLPF